jgi:signal transduction histidine kinase/ligand-binding sensor domain-containing protein/DNA-binding response OmpR family regulator
VEDGLSNNQVLDILQDDRGFMWFATENGVNRFDGYTFKVYKNDPKDSTTLSNNYVLDLFRDSMGTIWVGTLNGLNQYDPTSDRFIRFMDNLQSQENKDAHTINYIYLPDHKNNNLFWISCGIELWKFDRNTGNFKTFLTTKQFGKDKKFIRIKEIVKDFYGIYWLGTTPTGLLRFDNKRMEITPFRYQSDISVIQNAGEVNNLTIDHSGQIWYGVLTGEEGLVRIDPKTGNAVQYFHNKNDPGSISDNSISCPYTDSSGDVWIGTLKGGLNKFTPETKKFAHYMNRPEIPYTISSNSNWIIYEDRSHVFWVGNYPGGLNKFDRKSAVFNQLFQDIDNPINLFNVSVSGMVEIRKGEQNQLWIGTWGDGLLLLDFQTGKIIQYLHDPDNSNSLSDNIITRLATSQYEETPELWIATINGLCKYNLGTQKFTRFYHDPDDPESISNNTIRSVLVDQTGVVWAGTRDGTLDRFDPELNKFTRMDMGTDDIFCIFEDREGNLWLGDDDRLVKLNKDRTSFHTYLHDPKDSTSLSNPQIYSFHEYQFQNFHVLWVGTGGGLNRYDYKTEKFSNYDHNDGLPSDQIFSILEDNDQNLWIGTNKGLSKFNPINNTFRNYDTHDGLYQLQFNWSSCLKTVGGQLLFGGSNGITAFYPDSIRDNPHIPPIVITDFLIFSESVPIAGKDLDYKTDVYYLPQHISTLDEVTISYKENIFSFEFAALDYHSPQKNQYAYMMEGVDPDWVYTDASRRFASYTNLDPGEYIFRVMGSNSDGIWNEAGTSLKIIITPPWWLSGWAYAAYFFLIITVVVTTWRFQIRRIQLRNELKMKSFEARQLQRVDQVKSRFFANISHEFRTPLTLILGPVEQMLSDKFKGNVKTQYQMILRNGRRLLDLINQLLDLSKLESGQMKLRVSQRDILPYLKGVVQSFSSLAETKKITFTFKTAVDSLLGYVDQDKLEKIVNNLLSNAFKFTPENGAITVNIEHPPQSPLEGGLKGGVEISISNTGPGIPTDQLEKIFDRFHQADNSYKKDSEGTGIGLALTKELVQACHGEIRVESEPDKITTFTVMLPIGKEHFKQAEIFEEDDIGYQIPDTSDLDLSGIRHPPSGILNQELSIQDPVSSIKHPVSGPRSPVSGVRSPLLLIVEDNPDVTTYISSFLESEYRIITAENGADGWEKALKKFPDLVISDVMMPVMDGFELCKKLKTDVNTSHIPVILLTARADIESKLEGLEFGADDYVTKPFDTRELQVRSRNLLEQRRKLREKFNRDLAVQPHDVTVSSLDEQFLNKALEIVEQNLTDPKFTVDRFGKEMAMSRVHLHRKLHALTNQSSSGFIRTLRLKRAAQLLQKRRGNIAQIAYEVGFNNLSYFSKSFHKEFGVLPSEYLNQYS